MTLPDFLIIGVQKAGTVAAAKNLSLHPDIYCDSKELHFFDEHWKQLGWYKRQIQRRAKRRPRAELIGEKTPSYIMYPDRMAEVVPNARLVLLLRNPVERAISRWCSARSDRINRPDALDLMHRDMVGDWDKLLTRGIYYKQVRRLFHFFDRQRVCICISERVQENMAGEYGRIMGFLGVDPVQAEFMPHHETSAKIRPRQETVDFLKDWFWQSNYALFEMLGWEVPEWE